MDVSAIEEIYLEHFDQIYRFFYYKTFSHETAEELAAETFLQFADAVATNSPIKDPKSYLFGIARHIFFGFLHDKNGKVQLSEIPTDFIEYTAGQVESYSNWDKIADVLPELIAQLPEKQRDVIHLRLIEKLSLPEIAQKLKKDMNYVKVTQRRAIKSLQELVISTPLFT